MPGCAASFSATEATRRTTVHDFVAPEYARRTRTRPRTTVIDRNFHRDWRAAAATLVEHEGLLALQLPGGGGAVELNYRSPAMVSGLWISAAGLIVMPALFRRWRRWRLRPSKWCKFIAARQGA